MLVQIHILQSYAPSNLNRDQDNSPKQAKFGDYWRGRISSQCLKRAIRTSDIFEAAFKGDELLAQRTKGLPLIVQKELKDMKVDPQAIRDIVARVHEFGKADKDKGKPDEEKPDDGTEADKSKGQKKAKAKQDEEGEEVKLETKQLIFLAPNERRPFAEGLLKAYQKFGAEKWNERDPKKRLEVEKDIAPEVGKKSLPRSVDIALFGRMTTSNAFEDVEAVVQVAHAISTHKIEPETDFFTAFDDHPEIHKTAHLGDTEFNSCVYYKYFNLQWEDLLKNLGLNKRPDDDELTIARKAALALLEATAVVQPSGKRNAFGHNFLPDLVLVEIREKNLPVNYANAFVKPARADEKQGKSLVDDSVDKLKDHIARMKKAYSLDGASAYFAVQDYALPNAERVESLETLKDWLAQQLPR